MQKCNSFISAQQIASKFRISYPTVNHYTNLGFFSIVKRNGNRRLYAESEVKHQLRRIAKLKDEGYPLRLISKMLRRQ